MAPSWSLSNALKGMFARKTIDDETLTDLEDALIRADCGPDITDSIVDELRASVTKFRTTDPADLQRMLRETLEERLARLDPTLHLPPCPPPRGRPSCSSSASTGSARRPPSASSPSSSRTTAGRSSSGPPTPSG